VASSKAETVIEAGAAGDEPKLLPLVREVLVDATKKPEERIAAVLEFLGKGESGEGVKLIGQGTGENERATLERLGPGEVKPAAPRPTIDWDAPLRELIASKPFAHLYTEEQLRAFEEAEAAKVNAESEQKIAKTVE
jgi:hypothetical protein